MITIYLRIRIPCCYQLSHRDNCIYDYLAVSNGAPYSEEDNQQDAQLDDLDLTTDLSQELLNINSIGLESSQPLFTQGTIHKMFCVTMLILDCVINKYKISVSTYHVSY